MLVVCGGWMAPAIRRFGLEILPPADLALEHESLPCGAPAAMCRRSARAAGGTAAHQHASALRSNLKWGAVLGLGVCPGGRVYPREYWLELGEVRRGMQRPAMPASVDPISTRTRSATGQKRLKRPALYEVAGLSFVWERLSGTLEVGGIFWSVVQKSV